MNMELFILFIVLNAVNVILNTIKSLLTINGSKFAAAGMSAITYGFYTVVVIYMVCDLPLWLKAVTIGCINFIGVYIVKFVEEKVRKDKLWKVEVTVPTESVTEVDKRLARIPHSYIKISDKHTVFNCYCSTQKETQEVKKVVDYHNAKYFVAESKNL